MRKTCDITNDTGLCYADNIFAKLRTLSWATVGNIQTVRKCVFDIVITVKPLDFGQQPVVENSQSQGVARILSTLIGGKNDDEFFTRRSTTKTV